MTPEHVFALVYVTSLLSTLDKWPASGILTSAERLKMFQHQICKSNNKSSHVRLCRLWTAHSTAIIRQHMDSPFSSIVSCEQTPASFLEWVASTSYFLPLDLFSQLVTTIPHYTIFQLNPPGIYDRPCQMLSSQQLEATENTKLPIPFPITLAVDKRQARCFLDHPLSLKEKTPLILCEALLSDFTTP